MRKTAVKEMVTGEDGCFSKRSSFLICSKYLGTTFVKMRVPIYKIGTLLLV